MRRPLDKTDAYCINQQGRGNCVSSVFRKKLKKKYNINCCYSLLQINYGIEIIIIDNALVS